MVAKQSDVPAVWSETNQNNEKQKTLYGYLCFVYFRVNAPDWFTFVTYILVRIKCGDNYLFVRQSQPRTWLR